MSFDSLKTQKAYKLGTLSQSSLSTQGVLDSNEKSHLFKFKLSNRSSYSIQLQNLQKDASLKLLNRRETTLQKSNQSGSADESISADLKSGTYYLKVRLNDNGATDYSLNLSPRQTAERQQAAITYVEGDGISAEERKLLKTVNNYRERNGLPPIRLSKALSAVANRHVIDLQEEIGFVTHSWSDAPYDPYNPKTYKSMWEAPQRLNTGYPSDGYENIFGTGRQYTASAKDAFTVWKASETHNDLMINKGIWKKVTWKALGIGIYKGFASLWFGEKVDPTGKPQMEG